MRNSKLVVLFLLLVLLSIAAVVLSADENDLVTELPGWSDDEDTLPKQYAGFLPLVPVQNPNAKSSLFYWFFECSNPEIAQDPNTPVLLWLNGGPGCSSMSAGLLNELGPLKLVDRHRVIANEYGWDKVAHLLFIDNPVGVGFSYTDSEQEYANSEQKVADDMYHALLEFYKKFPEHRNRRLFLSGESYAGKYVPSIAERLVEANLDPKQESLNLVGIAIGDGLVDAIIQRMIQPDQAYNAGLVGYEQMQQMQTLQSKCIQWIQQNKYIEEGSPCEDLGSYLSTASGQINGYDVRTYRPTINNTETMAYLNRDDLQQSIHVTREHGGQHWEFVQCSDVVYEHLKHDILISLKYTIKKLTKYMKVLLYNGNFDLKDGPVGTEQYLFSMNLPGFNNAPRDLWIVDGSVAGHVKTDGLNLTFVTVHGAGHFVPHDQDVSSLDMMNRFLNNKPFCVPESTITLSASHPDSKALINKLGTNQISCRVSQTICQQFLSNCFGHGTCVNGACVCTDGYAGSVCAYPNIRTNFGATLESRSIAQQDWVYYQLPALTVDQGVLIANLSISVVVEPKNHISKDSIEIIPLQDKLVGDGLAVSSPSKRLCVYGKKGELPTWVKYDFVSCVDINGINANKVFTVTGVSGNKQDKWNIGIFNGMTEKASYQTSFSLKSNEEKKKPTEPHFLKQMLSNWQFWLIWAASIAITVAVVAIVTAFITVSYQKRVGNKQAYLAIK